MSASLPESVSKAPSAPRPASQAGAAASRPQVQSRRVSLKLGPLGISYATDQVLWTEAVLGAAAKVAGGSGSAADAASDAWQPGAVEPGAVELADSASRQTSLSFSQELLEAWKRQAAERASTAGQYGPGAAGRSARAAGSAAIEPAADEAGVSESRDEAGGGPFGDSARDADRDGASTQAQAAQSVGGQAATRVRRAIGAYLACARNFSVVRPMLTAVA